MIDVFLKVENVSVRLGSVELFSGLSFDVRPGEIVYVVGRSGAGKTVLLTHVAGLAVPDTGRVLVGSREVKRTALSSVPGLGYVPFDPPMLPDRTLWENVMLGNSSFRNELASLVEELGISAYSDMLPERVSLPLRRLFALVRMVPVAGLLVLDEPHTSLEPRLARNLDRVLVSLASQGMAILAAVHDPVSVSTVPHTVLFLEKGRVLYHGPRDGFLGFDHPVARSFRVSSGHQGTGDTPSLA